MNLVSFDFKDTYYLRCSDVIHRKIDPLITYTIKSIVPVYSQSMDINGETYNKSMLIPNIVSIYDFSTSEWTASTNGNDGIIGKSIIGVHDLTGVDVQPNIDRVQRIVGAISEDGTIYKYLFNDTAYLSEMLHEYETGTFPVGVGVIGATISPWATYVKDNYLFVADEDYGLRVFDISNKSYPYQIGNGTIANPIVVIVDGNYAYVTDEEFGLRIFDISTISSMLPLVGSLFLSGNHWGITKREGTPYVFLSSDTYFYIVNVSNPESPTMVQRIACPNRPYNAMVIGHYAYLASYEGGLRIFDVDIPVLVGEFTGSGYWARDVFVEGNYAYVVCESYDPLIASGLTIFDISDPTTPMIVGSYDTVYSPWGVIVYNNIAYVASPEGGLFLLDVTDPTTPTLISMFDTHGQPLHIHRNGSYIYVTNQGGSISIIAIDSGLNTNELVKEFGENKYWQKWGMPNYTTYGYTYALTKYKIDTTSFPTHVVLTNDTLVFNNVKEHPMYIQPLDLYKLPTSYSLTSITLQYSIDSETTNNSVGARLIDEQSREWVWSTTTLEWQYIGQAGGDYPTGSDFYNEVEDINAHINVFTEAKYIGIKGRIVSDSNDVSFVRMTLSYEDTSIYPTDTVKIYGNIKNILGVAKSGVAVMMTPKIPQGISSPEAILHGDGIIVVTDSLGGFEADVPANSTVIVSIPVSGVRAEVNVGTVDINFVEYLITNYQGY